MALAGKILAFSGTLSLTRLAAGARAKAAGAKVNVAVSGTTDILVCGPDAITTAKVKAAKDKGTAIWSEKDFNEALKGAPAPKANGGRGPITRVARQADGNPSGVAFRLVKAQEPVEDIPNGTDVEFLKADGEWCFIKFAGRKGWVKARNLGGVKRAAPAAAGPAAKKPKAGPPSKLETKELMARLGFEGQTVPEAPDRESFNELESKATDLKKQVRHSMVMMCCTKKDKRGTMSKLGGMPWMKAGDEWPTCTLCETQMAFLAQINFAETPQLQQASNRNNGLLQVWMCEADDCDTYEAFSGAHHIRIVRPGDFAKLDLTSTPPDGVGLKDAQFVAKWTRRPELPNSEELGDRGIEVADGADEWLQDLPRNGEKVGGWPGWVQGVEYPDCEECGEPMKNVLLQLEAGTIDGFDFGDCGTAHVTQCSKHRDNLALAWACG